MVINIISLSREKSALLYTRSLKLLTIPLKYRSVRDSKY
jgi:hypothetical protein